MFHGVERSEVGLKYLPQPDLLEFTLPNTHIALVINEGSSLTSTVIQKLQKLGNKVVVLNTPNTTTPNTYMNAVFLPNITDQAIQNVMTEIENLYGQVGSFIYLHPHFEFQNGNFTQHFQKDRTAVKTAFLISKYLQKPLNELGEKQRANFLTVTRMDGKLGQGKRGNVSVVGGGLTGLTKSLNLEWSPVYCRAVDIQPELSDEVIANQIILELHDADRTIVETGFSQEGRTTTTTQKVQVAENQLINTTVTNESVFLVSGGARGVTATCVVEMAKIFKCKFILLGRSSNDFELPAFAKNENDEGALKRLIMDDLKRKGEQATLPNVKSVYKNIIAKKEIQGTLDTILQHGGAALYVQGDVTNISSFKTPLKAATDILGEVTGVLHGAGRLADKFIQDKTEQDFENVLSVKLDGLLALLGSVDIHHLDHLILFSSVAGFYGNVGQTDYAIANEILSKAAHLFKTNHPNTQVSAINWGAWDAGMVSAALKKKFEEMGVTLVNSEGGAAMLINELNTEYASQPQVIIGGTLPSGISHIKEENETFRIQRKVTLEKNPFLNHHVIHGHAVMPIVNAVGWMAQSCERLYPDFKLHKIEDTNLFKGIVFDGAQPENFIVEAKEIAKNKNTIIFEATVLSEGGKLPTYHYKAQITLIHRMATIEIPTFQHQLSGTYDATNGAVLYQDGSLFHGKYFQGIEQIIDCTGEQIVLSCKAPHVPFADQGQFPVASVNTFFADIQYQGMVVWVQKYFDGAKSLPLKTDAAFIYEEVPFGKELFVHVKIVESNEFKLVADCTVYDETGKVYMFTQGAAVTISNQLNW